MRIYKGNGRFFNKFCLLRDAYKHCIYLSKINMTWHKAQQGSIQDNVKTKRLNRMRLMERGSRCRWSWQNSRARTDYGNILGK